VTDADAGDRPDAAPAASDQPGQSDPADASDSSAASGQLTTGATARRRPPRRVSALRRPGLAVGVGALGLGAAIAVPLLAVEAAQTLSDSTVGEIEVPQQPIQRLPDTPADLIAAVDENGQVASLVVLAGSPTGTGGTIIVVPTGSAIGVAGSTAKARVGSLYAAGDDGLDALAAGVEELLGITLNERVVLDEAALAEALAPYEPFDVELPGAVADSGAGVPAEADDEAGAEEDADDDTGDGPEILFDAGAQQLSASDLARVLTALPSNESEVVRLPEVTAAWQGVAQAVGEGVAVDAPTATPLQRLLAGPAQVRALNAEPVFDLAANPEEVDLLELDPFEVTALVGRVLPGAASPVSSGLRIKLIDATGEPAALRNALALFAYLRVAVVWIESGDAQEATVIHYRNADDVHVFEELEGVFGPVELAAAERPIEGVDATITLGRTFPEFPTEGGPVTVATTEPANPQTFPLGTSEADDDA
jgi:hypothetical protein